MGRPTCFDLAKLENLAERIYHGQVVFFVGAGFSLDSEGLTGARLLVRLLARFDALTAALIESYSSAHAGVLAARLRKVLRSTFWLGEDPQPLTTAAHAKALAADYYRPNEWMCEAFGTLLDACSASAIAPQLWADVQRRETALLEGAPIWGRVEQLGEIEPRLLAGPEWGPSARGKALFLDTLGFADPQVMAGRPHAPTIAEVERSYAPAGRNRLRPRHEVIARWAREGLCRTLLTTNYDVLVEGAYRLSGFACRRSDEPDKPPEQPPLLTEVSHFARVGEAFDFFRFGHTHRSALVAKIHGCAECYRWLRAEVVAALQADAPDRLARARESFANYLPAIVFTFREIQNWREDAWSRDLLANLLRTRSIVFCGYSTQDRVLHDAFRTAFEEIARVTRRVAPGSGHPWMGPTLGPTIGVGTAAGAGAAAEASRAQVDSTTADARAQRARAFFLGGPGALEFDALEILRAASRAEGVDHPPQTHHPNYLQFFFEGDDGPAGFPGLDQTMRWLWHRTLRIRQQQCVEIDLRRAATYLLGHACPERERERVLARLRELTDAETRTARGWEQVGPSEIEFDRVVGWSDRFHPALLREFAIAEAVLRGEGPGVSARVATRAPWFFPPSEQPQWSAWAVVIEIAVRRMIAAWRGELEGWADPSPCLAPGRSSRPALSFSRGDAREPSTPRALAMVLTGFDRRAGGPKVRGAFAGRVHHWRLRAQTVPWWPHELRPLAGTPSAATLWRWVVDEQPNPSMIAALPELLGIDRPVESGQSRPLRVA